ncbi:hypothetical protein AB1Y20_011884 [Prymnesium parvum]|uniref:DOT1 domain-containing protein n=1 Tax=Prymnesium parvum TaxID=97485 RepID=A0AB34IJD3_PRYPA
MASQLWLGSWLRFIVRSRLAPYVPTPPEVATDMLTLARLKPGERLVDLGSGDGRLLRAAVREFGAAHAEGFELDERLVEIARKESATLRDELSRRVVTHMRDAHDAGEALRHADVVTLYLSDRGNASILPLLRESLKPSARVVSFAWTMPDGIKPSRSLRLTKSLLQLHLYEGLGRQAPVESAS